MPTDLTDNIRRLREQSGLTREVVAREASISASTLQKIEAGREPTVTVLRRIAKALGTTPDDLFRPSHRDAA